VSCQQIIEHASRCRDEESVAPPVQMLDLLFDHDETGMRVALPTKRGEWSSPEAEPTVGDDDETTA